MDNLADYYFLYKSKSKWVMSCYEPTLSKYNTWKCQLKQTCEALGLEYGRVCSIMNGVKLGDYGVCSFMWTLDVHGELGKPISMSRSAFLAYLLETNEKKQRILAVVNAILPMPIAEELVQHISMASEILVQLRKN